VAAKWHEPRHDAVAAQTPERSAAS
jgi:hypothetical protein